MSLSKDEASLALERARQADDGTPIPLAVVKAEIAGNHPIAAWRADHGLSVQQLAEQAGVPVEIITAVEAGTQSPDRDLLSRIAAVLDVPGEVLEPKA
jgi:ribosome-binding protein aMBF1 (putative translation factor)